MNLTTKQLKHNKQVLQNSLNSFIKAINKSKNKKLNNDNNYDLLTKDWKNLINDQVRIKLFSENIINVASVFGFGREFSDKLTYEELISRSAERFSEFDLARHIIRELGLGSSNIKLEKLLESNKETCDFKLNIDKPLFAEAKYTKNISIKSIEDRTKKSLNQIKETMRENNGTGCVWIFTYSQPENPMEFQRKIENLKNKYINIGFPFTLNIQTYSRGLYGDAVVN